ncbi:MAG: tetratricopeptide repeat protein, partial [Vicinamibacteria bacterium]
VVVVVFGLLSVSVARIAFPLVVVAAPILAESITRLGGRPLYRGVRLQPVHIVAAAVCAFAASLFVLADEAGAFGGRRSRPFGFEINRAFYPIGAYRFLDSVNPPGEVFNEDAWGGSFIWAFYPRRKAFIDNRLEVYGEDFYRDVYWPIQRAEPGWEERLDSYGVNVLLLQIPVGPERLAQAALQSPSWDLVYWDDEAMVFLRKSLENHAAIARYVYQDVNPISFEPARGDRNRLLRQSRELDRSLREAPASIAAHNFLAIVRAELGDYEQSEALLRKALALDPENAMSLKNTAHLARIEARIDSAAPRTRPRPDAGAPAVEGAHP